MKGELGEDFIDVRDVDFDDTKGEEYATEEVKTGGGVATDNIDKKKEKEVVVKGSDKTVEMQNVTLDESQMEINKEDKLEEEEKDK